eukprot:Em0020g571a
MKTTSSFILSVVAKQLHYVRCAPQSRHVSPIFTSVPLAKTEGSFQGAGPPRALEESQYNALITMAKGHGHLVQREQFSLALKEFIKREKFLRGHVDFITLALRRMGEFGLQQDLLSYNRLLDIFPKDRFNPKTSWTLCGPMEEHGVRPDYTTYDLLCEVFGKTSLPVEKCQRLAYWFDRYENADPYQIKGALPEAQIELSRLTLQRVCGKGGVVTEIKGSDDFVLSASSAAQRKLLESLDTLENALLCVEGPHRIWMKKTEQFYYSVTLLPRQADDLRQSGEGAVLGVCMCSPRSHDNLKLWLRSMLEQHSSLRDVTVAYNVTTEETHIHTGMKGPVQLTDSTTSRSLLESEV